MNFGGENTKAIAQCKLPLGGDHKSGGTTGIKFELGVWKCGPAGPGTLPSNQTVTIILPNDIATCIDEMVSYNKPR